MPVPDWHRNPFGYKVVATPPPETTLFKTDTRCTLVPYFEVQDGERQSFQGLGPQFFALEPGIRRVNEA